MINFKFKRLKDWLLILTMKEIIQDWEQIQPEFRSGCDQQYFT